MDELQKLIEALQATIVEQKATILAQKVETETRIGALETKNASALEANAKVTGLESQLELIKATQLEIKTSMARLGSGGGVTDEVTEEAKNLIEMKSSLVRYMRNQSTESDVKTLNEYKATQIQSDNTLGGYLVTPEFGTLFEAKRVELSAMRQECNVASISGPELKIPAVENSDDEALWEGEVSSPESKLAFLASMLAIKVHPLELLPNLSRDLLEDADYDIMGQLMRYSNIKVSAKEGAAFHTGNGVNKPRGFLTYTPEEIEQIKSGDATKVTFEMFQTIEGSMKSSYKRGAKYYMTRTTLAEVKKLSDENKRPFLQYDGSKAYPNSINGFEIVEDPDMPEIAAGSLPIAFANFSEGYQIVDNAVKTFELLPKGFRDAPNVAFWHFRIRVGGAVRVKEAIKLIKIEA